MSAGAAAFQRARRDRVLLRDILRLGTATSALLSFVRVVPAGPGRDVGCAKQPQRRPSGVGTVTVAVPRANVREPRTALRAKARAAARAKRREREREHNRIAAHRLEIEQVSVEVVIFFGYLAVPVMDGQVTEELLELDLNTRGQRVQAPRALTCERRTRRTGNQHTLHHRLEPDVQLDIGALLNADQLDTEASWRRHGTAFGARRARLASERSNVEYERTVGIGMRREIAVSVWHS
jgi:hypothetical protein